MYLVTGGAGFIGSHLVRALNDDGIDDILVVDDLTRGAKFENLADCRIRDYLDKTVLREALERGQAGLPPLTAILHQGACSDTLEGDGRYMMENNFACSRALLHFALERRVPFVYASSSCVYGNSPARAEEARCERPLNVYGWSKLVFDQHVRGLLPRVESTVVGLRYFNVYGPREGHKGRMASMPYRLHRQLREGGVARLFEGTDGLAAGEQRRDLVHVADVARVNLFFARGPLRRGIVDVGTGRSRTFNELAARLLARTGGGRVEYVPVPPALRGRYQSVSRADLSGLRALGYEAPFTPLEAGLDRSLPAWEAELSRGAEPPAARPVELAPAPALRRATA